jgi:hypothetical protein
MEPTKVDISRSVTLHPSEDLLENYALGRLVEPALGRVETHLFVCHSCQDALLETDQYTAAMKAALAEPALQPETLSWPAKWAAFAGHCLESLRFSHPIPVYSAALATLSLVAMLSQSYTPGLAAREAEITLRSVRGGIAATQAQGPADTPLNLKIESRQLLAGQDLHVRIVDAAGKPAWAGAPQLGPGNAYVLRVDSRLGSGTYWVRLYDSQQKLMQEYGLQLN